MRIILIAAVLHDWVIGNGPHALLWKHPLDTERFVSLTQLKAVAMGRHTWESIPEQYRPLRNRLNIVLTKSETIEGHTPEVLLAPSFENAVHLARNRGHDELWVIGGEQLYREAIARANRLEITHVNLAIEGDRHFPAIDRSIWRITKSIAHSSFSFTTYERHIERKPAKDHLPGRKQRRGQDPRRPRPPRGTMREAPGQRI